jgi:hypothetical protein
MVNRGQFTAQKAWSWCSGSALSAFISAQDDESQSLGLGHISSSAFVQLAFHHPSIQFWHPATLYRLKAVV